MSKFFIPLGCVTALFALCGVNRVTHALEQYPPESALPGFQADAYPLPGESQLPPPAGALPSGLEQRESPPKTTDTQNTPGNRWPSEGDLPPSAIRVAKRLSNNNKLVDNHEDAAKAELLLQLENSADNRPWLRILAKGVSGRVRTLTFSHDSRSLMAAGDNKEVVVWTREQDDSMRYEQTIRWQIQRGERGRIHCLLNTSDFLAVAGNGAMGGNGEIVLFQPKTGDHVVSLVNSESGHRRRIVSLASAPSGASLVSMDQGGSLILWSKQADTGLWNSKVLAEDTPEQAKDRSFSRQLHPAAFLSEHVVVAPKFLRKEANGEFIWQLTQIDTQSDPKTQTVRPFGDRSPEHQKKVNALKIAPGGSKAASADESGRLFLAAKVGNTITWNFVKLPGVATDLAFSHDGQWLLAGVTSPSGLDAPAHVQLWNVSEPGKPSLSWTMETPSAVLACDISRDGSLLAYSQGREVCVHPLQPTKTKPALLSSDHTPPLNVGFANQSKPYVIGLTTHVDQKNQSFDWAFDTEKLQLTSTKELKDLAWPNKFQPANWSLAEKSTASGPESWLRYEGRDVAKLPLSPSVQGAVSATCWIPDEKGNPSAVAVGTSGNNGVYVFDLKQPNIARPLRQFRGHGARITSIDRSPDGEYLLSGSMDGVAAIWRLAGFDVKNDLLRRWGLELEIKNREVVVGKILEDGPLYFRGLRTGDTLKRLLYAVEKGDGIEVKAALNPEQIVTTLESAEFSTLIAFDAARGNMPLRMFQSQPAWHPVASLFVTPNREWAYFTPQGYYDASFEGHRLFGWQVNRGLNAAPDFFLAAQVRKIFERPDIMSRLLQEKSVDAALRGRIGALTPTIDVEEIQGLKPQVAITSPKSGATLHGQDLKLTATVLLASGQTLNPPKAFANGVAAVRSKLLSKATRDGAEEYKFEWDMRLPSDEQIRLQVNAGADQGLLGEASIRCDHVASDMDRGKRKPSLFIIAAGVDKYRDSRLRLSYAVNNAQTVAKEWAARGEELYHIKASAYLNDAVTPTGWDFTTERIAANLAKNAHPDDLVVIYLSGHGLRDEAADEYYYVTARAHYADLMSGQYADCLSFKDLAKFADVPCRKLVILDTCHAGAVQPSTQRQLKTALRALQDDVMFTLTATEGGQEAMEDRQKGYGRFTFRLVEALRGKADLEIAGDRNGVVTLSEAFQYVRKNVVKDSLGSEVEQHPTLGPAELLEFVRIPLTSAAINTQSKAPGPSTR